MSVLLKNPDKSSATVGIPGKSNSPQPVLSGPLSETVRTSARPVASVSLAGQSLAHCIQAASAKHLIVAAELADALDTALPNLVRSHGAEPPQVWIHGGCDGFEEQIESLADVPLEAAELREIGIDDRALC